MIGYDFSHALYTGGLSLIGLAPSAQCILSIFCWASNCTLIHIFQMIIFSSKMLQIRCSTPLNALENAREFEYPIFEAIGRSII